MAKQNLIGQTFGRLTVIDEAPSRKGKTYWLCECSCENHTKKEIRADRLKSGESQSCGCINSERVSKLNFKDLTNQEFGNLIPLFPTEERTSKGRVIWECKCKCGAKEHYKISSELLLAGRATSCPYCRPKSKGEDKIQQLLEENNIQFIKEFSYKDCKDIHFLPFDFYIIDKNYLIEFDGIQHFSSNTNGWNTQERFEKQKIHDNIKNNYCKDNNIPLIRIPYYKYDTLTIEDLLLETTKNRVV